MAKGHGYHKKRKRNWQPETAPGYASRQKNAHGEGEYPPPHVLANPAFEAYYRESGIVPEAEWDDFMSTLRRPLGVSFRITGHEDEPTARSLRALIERKAAHELSGIVVDGEAIPPPRPISWMPGRSAWRYEVSRAVLRGKGVRKNPGTGRYLAERGTGTAKYQYLGAYDTPVEAAVAYAASRAGDLEAAYVHKGEAEKVKEAKKGELAPAQ